MGRSGGTTPVLYKGYKLLPCPYPRGINFPPFHTAVHVPKGGWIQTFPFPCPKGWDVTPPYAYPVGAEYKLPPFQIQGGQDINFPLCIPWGDKIFLLSIPKGADTNFPLFIPSDSNIFLFS